MTQKHSLARNGFYADMAELSDWRRGNMFRSFNARTNITRSNNYL